VGREARCDVVWGARRGEVTVHLDGDALSVRGAFRASASRSALRDVRAEGGMLRFRADPDDVAFDLGAAAPRWASALLAAPPSLAAKLGIAAATRVLVLGTVDDDALAGAIAAGVPAGRGEPDVVVARVDDAAALERAADRHARLTPGGVRLWIVYTKGKNAPLGETAVRSLLRERGLIDVKNAAVSPALSALAFIRRG
jgi:hypothetical protein